MSTQPQYAIGQRYLSNTESELGLGAVIGVDFRTVELVFPATGETRLYSRDKAPLTRLQFAAGETVRSQDGWSLVINDVEEKQQVLIYHGYRDDTKEKISLPEMLLDAQIRLNQPEQRLFNFQLDKPKWFDLRYAAFSHLHQHATSKCRGLLGARIELIEHQLHIANEVGHRHAPRVLLADEVGLGKTIEAALIIHQQLQSGRASRVLILVPDSLVHQWLVEMLRRVNLNFSIYDDSRIEASEDQTTPFDQDQLVLCSLSFACASPQRLAQLKASDWDLLIVDEAHHLAWSESAPSPEYEVVEALTQHIPGVLLLTATPDQLGHESHFARLRLLDPARFYDYDKFLAEETHYAELADAVEPLISGNVPNQEEIDQLQTLAPEMVGNVDDWTQAEAREALLHRLIDCHGTGRLLFRNRRRNISGFPQRKFYHYLLEAPAHYLPPTGSELTEQLYPERQAAHVNDWFTTDPRVAWLLDFIQQQKPAKILLICAHAATALQLAEQIREKSGARHAVFHEHMSIVERDKAAHYFAATEDGAQILLCSEIGSEGRNFQFAHHLVLFDLPLTPDLLEQRIGRLDRIGQTQDVQIHVPTLRGTSQEVLSRWYHEGLNAFEQTCPTGFAVFEAVDTHLLEACCNPTDIAAIDNLIKQSKAEHQILQQALEQGRDRLLELNACGRGRIDQLLESIVATDSNNDLPRYMGRLLDAIGVNQEELGNDCLLLTPGEAMVGQLPGLAEEGMTITYRRRVATTLEHVHFITWDHPLVHSASELVITDLLGKSSVGFIAESDLPKGAYWVEVLFVLEAQAPKAMQLGRFLPPTPIRICLDAQGQLFEPEFDVRRPAGRKIAQQLIQALQGTISQTLEKARTLAHAKSNELLNEAITNMRIALGQEVARLKDLQQQNPAIRDSEIEFIEQQMETLNHALQQADVSMDAVRLVVNNP